VLSDLSRRGYRGRILEEKGSSRIGVEHANGGSFVLIPAICKYGLKRKSGCAKGAGQSRSSRREHRSLLCGGLFAIGHICK